MSKWLGENVVLLEAVNLVGLAALATFVYSEKNSSKKKQVEEKKSIDLIQEKISRMQLEINTLKKKLDNYEKSEIVQEAPASRRVHFSTRLEKVQEIEDEEEELDEILSSLTSRRK